MVQVWLFLNLETALLLEFSALDTARNDKVLIPCFLRITLLRKEVIWTEIVIVDLLPVTRRAQKVLRRISLDLCRKVLLRSDHHITRLWIARIYILEWGAKRHWSGFALRLSSLRTISNLSPLPGFLFEFTGDLLHTFIGTCQLSSDRIFKNRFRSSPLLLRR